MDPEGTARSARVGRPPLTDIRREQILDGVEECIVDIGLGSTTLDRIAERAGVSRTAVNHFIGTKDEVIDAALARSVARVRDQFIELEAAVPGPEAFERFVQWVLEPDEPSRRAILVVMDEVISVAYRDETARAHLAVLYGEVDEIVARFLASSFPGVPAERLPLIAEALVALLREFDRIRALGVCVEPEDMPRRARIAIEALLRGYEVI